MDWKPRVYWALLAVATAIVGWRLTVMVTHVDREASSTIEVFFDEQPTTHPELSELTVSGVQRERFRIPGFVMNGTHRTLAIVTPRTRSFALANVSPKAVSCRFSDRVFQYSPPPVLAEASAKGPLQPVSVLATPSGGTVVVVPRSLHAALVRARSGQGIIACESSRQLAASPTFTDRAVTLHVDGLNGPFFFDVSALEDVDNLRFSGGVAFPLTGERTRFLDPTDNLVSAEWVDVSAAERRDIVLVTVGALAAIGAAMAIEAIRPFIERART